MHEGSISCVQWCVTQWVCDVCVLLWSTSHMETFPFLPLSPISIASINRGLPRLTNAHVYPSLHTCVCRFVSAPRPAGAPDPRHLLRATKRRAGPQGHRGAHPGRDRAGDADPNALAGARAEARGRGGRRCGWGDDFTGAACETTKRRLEAQRAAHPKNTGMTTYDI